MAHEWAEGREWSEFEMDLFEGMAHETDALNDGMLQSMFHTAFFDDDVSHDLRVHAREWVEDHLEDEYDFQFDEYFDWEAWREEHGYGHST